MNFQQGEPKRKQSVKEYIWEQFEDESTVQGVPHALKHKYRCMKIFWIIAVMSCTGVMLYQSYSLFNKFFHTKPIKTVFQEGEERSVFPDVTICNIYPLTRNNELQQEYDFQWYDYRRVTDSYGLYPRHADELENNDRLYYDIVSRPTQYFINFQIQDFRNRSYENTTNLIIDCKFLTWINNNITCLSPSTIEVIWNANHYTCYTFKVPESERRNVRFLSTILYIDNFPLNIVNSISPDLTQSEVGVRAMIHSR